MKNSSIIFIVLGCTTMLLSACEFDFDAIDFYDERNVFTGWYEVEEYSEGSASTFIYDIHISKSRHDDGLVWISNFYDADISVFAEVSAYQLYIPPQRIDNIEVEGRGTYYGGDELSLTYTVREIMPGPDYVDFLSCYAWRY